MDSNAPSLATSGPIPTEVLTQPDRRQSPRTDCHTVVTAVTPQGDSTGETSRTYKIQSENISSGGAKLISREPLPSPRLYLRFLLPTHWDRFLEAEVVSESVCERKSLIERVIRQYVYRVRFTGVEHKADETGQMTSPSADSPSR